MKNYRVASVVSVLAIVLLTLSFVVAVNAQYESQQTANFTVGSNGVAHVDQSSTGGLVSIDIAGNPGSAGSVSIATYADNPQPDAVAPVNIKLADFIVITFNMPAEDFHGANLVFYYNASEVSAIVSPFSLYKYVPASNSYILQDGIVDANAQTITLSISSPTDPLFAIGGASAVTPTPAPGTPSWVWLALVLVVIIIIAVVVLASIIMGRRKKTPFEVIS